ncbi:MAG: AEC family transporter [Sphingobacteriia bacterium]|nr:AEC family transporter [Sphingobacteriia bacterium]
MYGWIIFQKLIALYLNIFLGFICARFLKVAANDIAKLIFYLITPFVIFQGLLKTNLDENILLLPFCIFIICCILCGLFYYIAGKYWRNTVRNIVAFSAGTGNSGFLGLPIAIGITNNNDYLVGTYITATLGVSLYENTLGYFIAAKGENTGKECLKRLVRLPILYAFVIGTIANLYGLRINSLPANMLEFLNYMQGCYVTLGIIIIGIALGQVEKFSIDYKFLGVTFFAKFICWPMLMTLFILMDKSFFHLYNEDIYDLLMLMSIVPLATNTVTLSILFKVHPEKAATTVLAGAIFAMFYMSIMINYVIK